MVLTTDGEPVAGARVSPCEYPERAHLTDDQGAFELSSRGVLSLCVSAAGFARREVALRARRDLTIALLPGGILVGRVLRSDGDTPVPGALLEVEGASAIADPRGWFVVEGVAAGSLTLRARAPGLFGDLVIHDLTVGEVRGDLVVRAFAAADVVGRALIGSSPCERGAATLTAEGDHHASIQGGEVRLVGIPAGRYHLGLRCSDGSSLATEVDVPAKGLSGIDWQLRQRAHLAARVVDPEGRPVPGVLVAARQEDEAWVEHTNDRGVADLDVPVGDLEVRVLRSFRIDPVFTRAAAGQRIEVRLVAPPVGTLCVTASDHGSPVAGVPIEVQSLEDEHLRRGASTDGSGVACLPLVPGRWRVYRPGGRERDATLLAGAQVDLAIEVRRPEPRAQALVVVDSQRRPIEGAFVIGAEQTLVTDREGRATMTDDDEAAYVSTRDGRSTTVSIREQGPGPITVVLGARPARSQVRGLVRLASGAAPETFRVMLWTTSGEPWQTFSGTQGRFVLDDVPQGENHLSVVAADESGEIQLNVDEHPETVLMQLEPAEEQPPR